jgi:hypothetical protein
MLLNRANVYRLEPTAEQARAFAQWVGACRFYVYCYMDPRPGRIGETLYIGKGTVSQHRAYKHWKHKADNIILNRIFKECRALSLVPPCEIVATFDEEAAAFAHERELIARLGRRDLGRGPLCNLTDGGEGASGHIHTSEARAKMATAHTGLKRPPEVINKCAEFHRGRQRSSETKAKLSAISTGKRHTPETRAKLSAIQTGKKHTLQHRISIAITQAAKRGSVARTDCEEGIGCPHCGMLFPARTHGGGRSQRFCSDRCRMGHKRKSPICLPVSKQLRETVNVAS